MSAMARLQQRQNLPITPKPPAKTPLMTKKNCTCKSSKVMKIIPMRNLW